MKLPQDRILHIGTEFKNGKVNIVAEWQGELIRCKDCVYSRALDGVWECGCPNNNFCEIVPLHFCSYGERRTE